MKKIIAALTAIAAAMTMSVFAERYVSADDLELATLTEDKALEDGFTIKATPEKNVEIKQSERKAGDDIFTQAIKLGGGGADFRSITFSAEAGQKVTVYGLSSSKTDSRTANVCSEDGTVIGSVSVNADSGVGGQISTGTVSVPANGNYYVTSAKSTIYIYQVVIE